MHMYVALTLSENCSSQVLSALSQLEFGSEVWERVLFQAFEILTDSNDEPLVAAMSFVFKAASQCQHLPQAVCFHAFLNLILVFIFWLFKNLILAILSILCKLLAPKQVRAVRSRLKSLSAEVPHCVLDVLTKTVHTWPDVAEAILRDIDSDCDLDGLSGEVINMGEEQQIPQACLHMSDVYILIEMLSIPGIFVEVSKVLEKAVLRGNIELQSVAMVLERRHRLGLKCRSIDDSPNKQILIDGKTDPLPVQEDDFTSILALGEVFSLSRDARVQDFVRMLYAIMFKIYSEDHYRVRMLKGLVDRAMNTSDSCRLVDIDMDVLVFLVREEDEVARPVLNMMREVAEVSQGQRAALWHQICAIEDENIRIQEERQTELANFTQEKALLMQRLTESEATASRIKVLLLYAAEH